VRLLSSHVASHVVGSSHLLACHRLASHVMSSGTCDWRRCSSASVSRDGRIRSLLGVVVMPALVDSSSSVSSHEEDFNEQVAQDKEESNENPCFNGVLLATVTGGRERIAASVVAPAQRGKDECNEPEVAEDEMQRCQNSSVLWETWGNCSDKINNHGNDSNDFHVHKSNISVGKLLQKITDDGGDNNRRNKREDVADERTHPEAHIGETSS